MFKVGSIPIICKVVEKFTERFGQNNGTNIQAGRQADRQAGRQTDISFYICTNNIYLALPSQCQH